ncbi:helicase-related protein [Alcanivorax sp.]|uniref:helicase-related protein n=1 Tax=Alcanivorax sp. TaxID=1872427 RepID=UPI003BA8FE0F
MLALTATATPQVAEQICSSFDIARADHIQTGFFRPNLALAVRPCRTDERDQYLLDQLTSRPAEPAIVYVTLQKAAETVAAFLQKQGLKAQAYHAGLKDEPRHQVQEAFMAGEADIVVATIAFGMGHRQGRHPRHLPLQPAQVPGKLYAGKLAGPGATGSPRTVSCWPTRTT